MSTTSVCLTRSGIARGARQLTPLAVFVIPFGMAYGIAAVESGMSNAQAIPAGIGVAMSLRFGWPVVLIMGVMTGTFGGLMRDVVANEVPIVLRQGELYVSAALGGATVTL